MKRISFVIGMAVLAVAAMLAGTAGSATPTAAHVETSGVPASLAGLYVASFTGKERTSNGPKGLGLPPGSWVLVLRGNKATITNPVAGVTFSIGRPSVIGSRITFASADPSCPDRKLPYTNGTYRFALNGKTLQFKRVTDSSNCRASTLTSHAWTRQK